jgi:hypothetical protein
VVPQYRVILITIQGVSKTYGVQYPELQSCGNMIKIFRSRMMGDRHIEIPAQQTFIRCFDVCGISAQ